jgi:hypothetical protein
MTLSAEAFAKKLKVIREWERANLPMNQPQIALDILIYGQLAGYEFGDAGMKDLHLNIQHSEDRVREVRKNLIMNGWLAIDPHGVDGRSKCIRPTPRLTSLFEEYGKVFQMI